MKSFALMLVTAVLLAVLGSSPAPAQQDAVQEPVQESAEDSGAEALVSPRLVDRIVAVVGLRHVFDLVAQIAIAVNHVEARR